MSQKSRPVFISKFEGTVYDDLMSKKIDASYEPYKIDYAEPEVYHKYIPDIILPNGIIVECKGYFPLEDRKKRVFIRSYNPHLDIRMLFMDASAKILKGSKITLGTWATKHKFKWAEGLIPDEWVNEKENKNTKTYDKNYDHRLYFKRGYGIYSKWQREGIG